MLIDAHVHLKHGDKEKTEYSPETIIDIMNKAGVDKSVLIAMSTSTEKSMEMIKQAVAQYPERLIGFAYALPSYEKSITDEIKKGICDYDFKGIKIHAGECTLAEYIQIEPVMKIAEKFDIPCLIDAMGQHDVINNLVNSFQDTKFIIAHLGQYLCYSEEVIDKFINIAKNNRNVYLDISGVILPWKVREAIERVGSHKLIFGSDGPKKQPPYSYDHINVEMAKVKSMNLNPEDEANIMGQTISRLLKL